MNHHAEVFVILLLGFETKILFSIVVADVTNNLAEQYHVIGITSILHPFADQTAEDAAEVLMTGIAEKAAAVCKHADETGEIAEIGKTGKLIGHALEVIIEPPRRAMLQLGNSFIVLF